MNANDIQSAAASISSWMSAGEIDSDLLAGIRYSALCEAVSAIGDRDKSAMLRIVVQLTQHGTFGIHAETAESNKAFIQRFRSGCNWHQKHTDEELYSKIGPWYFDSFGFGCAEYLSKTYTGKLMDAEYNLWQRLDDHGHGITCYHNSSAIEAIVRYESSRHFAEMNKANDFELRLFDGNSVEWEANNWLLERRQKKLA